MRCALAMLAFTALPLAAKHLYQWKDANGITHFSDRKPPDGEADGLKTTLVEVDEQPMVDLIPSDEADGTRRYAFSNRLGGPVQLELSFENATNVVSEPALPLRTVLPAFKLVDVARVRVAAPGQATYSLSYRVVPGDPAAQPDLVASYQLPLPPGTRYQIHQGFNGAKTHNTPESRYAVDFAVDEGTPVLAARDGVVMETARDFHGAGDDRERYGSRANLVRVLHADGSMAVYAHLALEGVRVTVGQRVRTGQVLAASGNTGYSTGPHLHFAVQVNTGMALVSCPYSIAGVRIPGQ